MKKADAGFDAIGTAALAGSILCWSVMPPMLKSFTIHIDAWTMNGVRYPFVALLWSGPLIYQYRRGRVDSSVWKAALLPTAVNLFAQTLWAWLPYFIPATHMAFLARISVVFGIAGGFLCFEDERPLMRRPLFWAGAVCSATGFIVMNLPNLAGWSGKEWFGTLLVFVCGAFYGLYGVAVRYSMRGHRPWVAFPVISIYTSVVLFLLMFFLGEPTRLLAMPKFNLSLLLLSAVIGIAAAHTFFYMSIEHLGVAISSGSQLLGPFLTFLWAFLFLGETLTLIEWIGGTGLVLGGLLLIRTQTALAPASMDADKAPIEPKLPD